MVGVDLTGSRHSRNEQLRRIAQQIGKTPSQLRQAVFDADGGSGAQMLTLSAKVPLHGQPRKLKLVETSLLVRTARQLDIDPRILQQAIIQSRPNAKPGATVALGIRVLDDTSELRSVALSRYTMAQEAAAQGDLWASEYVRLADQLRLLARGL
jgi:hypothetical protein